MLAYTAWDSLQTIARQYDADLEILSEDHITLAPRWARSSASAAMRRLAERVRTSAAVLIASALFLS
jgi:hypothetical protein